MNREQRKAWGPVVLVLRETRSDELTQEQLAQAAGTTRQTVSAIETGRSVGQEAVLRRLLAHLGIDPETQSASDIVSTVHQGVLPHLDPDLWPSVINATMSLFMGGGTLNNEIATTTFDSLARQAG